MGAELNPREDGDLFLDAAKEIGHRLVDTAVWHKDRCTWLGDDVDADGEVIHHSMAGDLYGGTSGIGWALGRLWQVTGDDDLARVASGALRHCLYRANEDPVTGLYTGGIGTALATVTTGNILGDPGLVSEGADLAATVAQAVLSESAGGDPDLIAGSAGKVLGLLALSRALQDDALQEAAVAVGERLLAAARPDAMGWTWSLPDAGEPPLCGLGHGASGLALALLELEAASGEARFGEAMRGALRYERAWFNRAEGNWPDLRELDAGRAETGARPPYPVFWCHGASGIGLVRLRVHQQTGDLLALAEAGAAIDSATATILRALAGSGREPAEGTNLSLCHGVGSVIELHVVAAEVTGDQEHLAHARRLGRWALRGGEQDPGPEADFAARVLASQLPCGVPGGGETPGLMLGLAGIGAFCLRLYDPSVIQSPALPWQLDPAVRSTTRV